MTEPGEGRRCAWCEAVAAADATHCPKCGAALAQREDLGGFVIPGVTGVHPELAAAADRPLHLGHPSVVQGAAPGLIGAVIAPGPAGIAIGAGIAALAAAEYLTAPHGGLAAPDLEDLGRPSESALMMVERLKAEEPGDSGGDG